MGWIVVCTRLLARARAREDKRKAARARKKMRSRATEMVLVGLSHKASVNRMQTNRMQCDAMRCDCDATGAFEGRKRIERSVRTQSD